MRAHSESSNCAKVSSKIDRGLRLARNTALEGAEQLEMIWTCLWPFSIQIALQADIKHGLFCIMQDQRAIFNVIYKPDVKKIYMQYLLYQMLINTCISKKKDALQNYTRARYWLRGWLNPLKQHRPWKNYTRARSWKSLAKRIQKKNMQELADLRSFRPKSGGLMISAPIT